jgi:hypothetical protein
MLAIIEQEVLGAKARILEAHPSKDHGHQR